MRQFARQFAPPCRVGKARLVSSIERRSKDKFNTARAFKKEDVTKLPLIRPYACMIGQDPYEQLIVDNEWIVRKDLELQWR